MPRINALLCYYMLNYPANVTEPCWIMAKEQGVDKERYRASMARLDAIFRGMSDTVTDVSRWRCPYKNAQSRCTAQFGCRNQQRKVPQGELYICVGDDNLDYRSAWEI